jgi:hypothetical protein
VVGLQTWWLMPQPLIVSHEFCDGGEEHSFNPRAFEKRVEGSKESRQGSSEL